MMAVTGDSSEAWALACPVLAKLFLGTLPWEQPHETHILSEFFFLCTHLKCLDSCFSEVAVLWENISNQNEVRFVSSYQRVVSL